MFPPHCRILISFEIFFKFSVFLLFSVSLAFGFLFLDFFSVTSFLNNFLLLSHLSHRILVIMYGHKNSYSICIYF